VCINWCWDLVEISSRWIKRNARNSKYVLQSPNLILNLSSLMISQLKSWQVVRGLGLNISNDLKWNGQINEILTQERPPPDCINFLRQLKRTKIAKKDLVTFYTTCTLPITEYACPVFIRWFGKDTKAWKSKAGYFQEGILILYTVQVLADHRTIVMFEICNIQLGYNSFTLWYLKPNQYLVDIGYCKFQILFAWKCYSAHNLCFIDS
jgi:hypothetical protein